jgi:predicted ATP-dependent endonuclease of OLD family
MNYRKFYISKYKALKNIEINLRNNLIPIIGINESGKTSVLQAILAFDNFNDDILGGSHLLAKNRYDYDSIEHKIQAHVDFDSEEEICEIMKELGYKKSSKLFQELLAMHTKKECLIITRNLDDYEYKIENLKSSVPSGLIESILNTVPYTLYFDDFTDRVPDKIIFPSTYVSEGYDKNTDSLRKDWNEYIEELFLKATDNDLESFIDTDNTNDRNAILSDVNDRLNEDIIKDWKKLKILNKELTDEKIADLKIDLKYELEPSGNHCFQFKIVDKNYKQKNRFFDISERSKGFQWFFNFAIKLKFNPKYINDSYGAIYLLDEPGSYLHATAQEELLKSLKSISESNKVIYCTHSQYLLNPEVINVNSIKVASRTDGSIELQNLAEYEDSSKSFSALNPLYDALHLSILHDANTILNQEIIITEGITDFYFLKMLTSNRKEFSSITTNIIPGSGADNLKDLVSFAIAWAKKYTVFLDSDEQGRKAYKRYLGFFGEEVLSNFKLYKVVGKDQNVDLEDFLDEIDKATIIKATTSKNVKAGIVALYFGEKSKQREFFESLSRDTIKNLEFFKSLIKI